MNIELTKNNQEMLLSQINSIKDNYGISIDYNSIVKCEFYIKDNEMVEEEIDGYNYSNLSNVLQESIIPACFSNMGYDVLSSDFLTAVCESFYFIDTEIDEPKYSMDYDIDYFENKIKNEIKIASTFEKCSINKGYRLKNGTYVNPDVLFNSYDLLRIYNYGYTGFIVQTGSHNEKGYLAIGDSPYDPNDPNNTIFYPMDPETGEAFLTRHGKKGANIFKYCEMFMEEHLPKLAELAFLSNQFMCLKELIKNYNENVYDEIGKINDEINVLNDLIRKI